MNDYRCRTLCSKTGLHEGLRLERDLANGHLQMDMLQTHREAEQKPSEGSGRQEERGVSMTKPVWHRWGVWVGTQNSHWTVTLGKIQNTKCHIVEPELYPEVKGNNKNELGPEECQRLILGREMFPHRAQRGTRHWLESEWKDASRIRIPWECRHKPMLQGTVHARNSARSA